MGVRSYIHYTSRDALRSLWRHKGMALASILTVALSLFFLGSTLLLVLNSQNLVETMESQLEINVFLKPDISRKDALAFKEKIDDITGVQSIEFLSKEKALEMLQERFGKDADILKALGGVNPLPDSYRLKASSSDMIDHIVSEIGLLEEVDNVRYGKELVDKLLAFTLWVRNMGTAVIIGMLLAGLFLITVTIRLTVFARKKEINIMKYVGATNGFIRFPFFLEGLIIGLIGSLIAGGILYFGYQVITGYIIKSVPFIPVVTDKSVLFRVLEVLFGGGTLLGAFGSILAVRKYLKV